MYICTHIIYLNSYIYIWMTVPVRIPGQTPGAAVVRPPLAPAHRTKPSFVLYFSFLAHFCWETIITLNPNDGLLSSLLTIINCLWVSFLETVLNDLHDKADLTGHMMRQTRVVSGRAAHAGSPHTWMAHIPSKGWAVLKALLQHTPCPNHQASSFTPGRRGRALGNNSIHILSIAEPKRTPFLWWATRLSLTLTFTPSGWRKKGGNFFKICRP